MGNIYVGMSVGFGFILFCLLMAILWNIFCSIKRRMFPEQINQRIINLSDYNYEEKREHQRVGIKWSVIVETVEGVIRGETKDLSIGGAFIKCQDPFPPGRHFNLTIELPDREPVILNSEVVWSNGNVPDDKVINRGMGVRFIKNSVEKVEFLNSAIRDFLEYCEPARLQVGIN